MKLKTMLAVVAGALGLCATAVELPDGVSFEQTAGVVPPGGITEAKGATWAAADAENTTLEVKEYGTETKYTYTNPNNARNEMFDAQDNYLSVKTKIGSPLNRTAEVAMGTGVYFDSLVKFTACDEVPADGSYSDAKLVAYVLEDETNGTTNFFVRAVGGDYNLGGVTDIESWHRLTIKAIPGIYKGEERPVPGFAIYLDGNAVAATDADYATKSTITAANLTNNAKVLFGAKNLFVSLNGGTANYQKITSVGFDGQGAIDDLAFTTTAPVTAAADLLFATVKIGEKIASFTVDGVTYTEDADAQIINGKVAVSDIVYRSGYFGPTSAELDAASGAELALDDQAKDIVATIDDAPYASIEEALDAADGTADIVLQTNVTAEKTILVNKAVTIDLNGKTVTGAAGVDVFTIGAEVIFDDNGETGKVVAVQAEGADGDEIPYAYAIVEGEGESVSLTIKGGTFAGKAEDDDFGMGRGSTVVITGGWFLNDPSGWLEGTDYEAVQDETHDNYFKVQEKQVEMGTVIILVDGAEKKTLEPQEVGTTVDLTAVEGLKANWQKLTWADVDDPTAYEVVKGEQRLNATTDINLTLKDGSYEIGTAVDLQTLADAVAGGYATAGKTFKQTANIDLAGIAWTGIGAANNKDKLGDEETYKAGAFQGTYDGGSFTVSNITLSCEDYIGFFGSLYGATVKNLKLSAAGTGFAKTGDHAATEDWGGALAVGVSVQSTIENVETLAGTTFKAYKATAGIVGYAAGGTVLKGCVNRLNVTSIGNEKVAGLVACAQNSGNYTPAELVIDGCSNEGNVECQATGKTRAALLVSYTDFAVKFQGNITARGTVTQAGSAANIQSIININGGSATVVEGAVITAPDSMKSTIHNGKAHAGLNYATCAEGVATFVADAALAKGNTYKVMTTGNTVAFELAAEDDWIAFDQALATATLNITSATGVIETNKTGDVTKFLAKAAAPSGVEPGKPVGLGNPGSMTLEEAQAAAAKLKAVPTAEQTAAGIKAEDLQVKAVFNGSIYQAVAEPADKWIPEVETTKEDVQPIEVTDTDFGATIKNAKKGFYYGFVAADELKANVEFAPAATFVTPAADGELKLTAPKAAEGNARFYKLSVSAVPVTVE